MDAKSSSLVETQHLKFEKTNPIIQPETNLSLESRNTAILARSVATIKWKKPASLIKREMVPASNTEYL
jgi:hypothetical protein